MLDFRNVSCKHITSYELCVECCLNSPRWANSPLQFHWNIFSHNLFDRSSINRRRLIDWAHDVIMFDCSLVTNFSKSSAVAEMGDRLATIDMGRKVGAPVPPFWGMGRSPSNIMSPGPRASSLPSSTLIHLTVWPQYTNVTDRTDRQTGQTTVR